MILRFILLSMFIGVVSTGFAQQREVLIYHPIRTDKSGKSFHGMMRIRARHTIISLVLSGIFGIRCGMT